FSSRRRHTRSYGDWSSDVCSSDLGKRIESAENPNSEKHPSVGEQPCDVAGRSNDAGSDGIADGRGHAKPHAENLEQAAAADYGRAEEHTSELQSPYDLVCRLQLEK